MLNFDLNLPSDSTDEAKSNDVDYRTSQFDVNYNGEVPVTITILSLETLIIDLNVNPNSDCEYSILEIDTNQIGEEERQHVGNGKEDANSDGNLAEEVQMSSRNRGAGTMELKAMTSVRRDDVKEFFIEKTIPAIQAKWPRSELGQTIYIEQNNVRTHVQPTE
ncbi:hypothetical protein LIER_41431 [Lithospermum erythrorhizon]|uniref:Uncharacterized protein n=1 Tax=Lithospermum erythrorhizon TaxID=34254 RepID=A0AAV3RCG0_LITER